MHFRINDVRVPDPVVILRALHGEDLLQGKVIALTDSGQPGGTYAVVEVSGMERPLIVPTGQLMDSF